MHCLNSTHWSVYLSPVHAQIVLVLGCVRVEHHEPPRGLLLERVDVRLGAAVAHQRVAGAVVVEVGVVAVGGQDQPGLGRVWVLKGGFNRLLVHDQVQVLYLC